jgi:hypothetical protein
MHAYGCTATAAACNTVLKCFAPGLCSEAGLLLHAAGNLVLRVRLQHGCMEFCCMMAAADADSSVLDCCNCDMDAESYCSCADL